MESMAFYACPQGNGDHLSAQFLQTTADSSPECTQRESTNKVGQVVPLKERQLQASNLFFPPS